MMRKAAGIVGGLLAMALALSACGAPMPSGKATPGGARAGQQPVTVGGQAYVAEVQPGNPGLIITKAGATAVKGMTVRVTGQGRGLGPDQGIAAKAAAKVACAQAGGVFNDRAVGRVAALGVWAFEGGCG